MPTTCCLDSGSSQASSTATSVTPSGTIMATFVTSTPRWVVFWMLSSFLIFPFLSLRLLRPSLNGLFLLLQRFALAFHYQGGCRAAEAFSLV